MKQNTTQKSKTSSKNKGNDIPLCNRLKVVINDNGYESWGVTSIKQKTAYRKDKPDTIASATDIKQGNFRYPARYFAYAMINNKPVLFVENRDKLQDGTYSERYFKPATIKFHKTNKPWTHNDRITGQPFLSCVMYTDAEGNELSTDKRLTLSARIGECFHVDNQHKFKVMKIPTNEKLLKHKN